MYCNSFNNTIHCAVPFVEVGIERESYTAFEGGVAQINYTFLSNFTSVNGFHFVFFDVEVVPVTATGTHTHMHMHAHAHMHTGTCTHMHTGMLASKHTYRHTHPLTHT